MNYEHWTWTSTRDQINQFDSEDLVDLFRTYHDICIETDETLRIRSM